MPQCTATLLRSLSILTLVAALVFPSPIWAERELIDRVVAMVDDEAILLSDVLREMNLVRLQRDLRSLSEEEQDELFDQILEEMVNDQLLVAQAKEKGIEVGDQELQQAVDEAIAAIKQRIGDEERYQEELQKQGLTEAEIRDMHREQRRKQILASRVIQSELRSKISISDDQVVKYWLTQRDSLPDELRRVPAKLRLAHILIVPSADDQEAAVRQRIEGIAARIRSGEDFAKVASETSEWPTAQRGGDLGEFRYGDFNIDAFDETVSKLEPGQVSEPFETRLGWMIVKLEERKGDVMRARHIVLKMTPSENAQVAALETTEELRRRILAGESFEELAASYSDDPNSRDRNGVLEDEWAVPDLLPEFRKALEKVGVGEISSVVQSQNGFHIFKVLSRTESRETTFEDVRELLRRYLEQRELETRFRAYVEGLRQRFHVDIKA